jgi:hypothetical protein
VTFEITVDKSSSHQLSQNATLLGIKPLPFVLWLWSCLQRAFEFFCMFDISQRPQSDEAFAHTDEFRSYDLAASDPHVHRLT